MRKRMAAPIAKTIMAMAIIGLTAGPAPAAQGDIGHLLAGARHAYGRGDLPAVISDLGAALAEIQTRLGTEIAALTPASRSGWTTEPAQIHGLGSVGGGLAVARAYLKGESSLTLSIILDNPAVGAAKSQLADSTPQPNLTRLRVKGVAALVRWNPLARSGEVTLVLGRRMLVEIGGDGLADARPMIGLARTVDIAGLRKLLRA